MTSFPLSRFFLPIMLAIGLGGCVAYGADYGYGGGGGAYYGAPAYAAPAYVAPQYVAPAYGYRAPRYYSPPPRYHAPSHGGYGHHRPHHRQYEGRHRGW